MIKALSIWELSRSISVHYCHLTIGIANLLPPSGHTRHLHFTRQGLLTFKFDRATRPSIGDIVPILKLTGTSQKWQQGIFLLKQEFDRRYLSILKPTRTFKKYRQGTLAFLKIDSRLWGPTNKGPGHTKLILPTLIIIYHISICWDNVILSVFVGIRRKHLYDHSVFIRLPIKDINFPIL